MRMVPKSEKALSPLDLTGPASQVGERWRKWKRAFEYFAEGKGVDNVRKKTSLLLHFAGMDVQDIFEELQDPSPIPESDDNVYRYFIAIRKLDSCFKSRRKFPTSDMFFVNLHKWKGRPLTNS